MIKKNKILWKYIENFKESDFSCKCGCGLNNISSDLIYRLNIARLIAGVYFIINSACRCKKHNKLVGGSLTSSHLLGLAVDIAIKSPNDRFIIVNSLLSAGFTRIGVYKNFIHVDLDITKPQNVIWYL